MVACYTSMLLRFIFVWVNRCIHSDELVSRNLLFDLKGALGSECDKRKASIQIDMYCTIVRMVMHRERYMLINMRPM